jgi:ABC-type lipoprotein release transport system permease subunit
MILGIAFPAFFISPLIDAKKPFIEYLQHVSVVSPRVGRTVDPSVTAQIKTHPSVRRVIPAIRLDLGVSIPPTETVFTFYGVSENDLPELIDLYGGYLKEGHLPHPRSNEIVLSEAVALNRGLRLGDTVGRPVNDLDSSITTEMVVVGILGPGKQWMGFASYEYLESHEFYSFRAIHLLVVPTTGHKVELDNWLEKNVASTQTNVRTYDTQYRELQESMRGTLLLFAGLESVITIIAAIALAVLNYIFFAQRREEFGVLHAMGCTRVWLILRAAKETISAVTAAWLIGALVCVFGLILIQVNIYLPMGMSLDFSNPAPWLFTLPIPLAVIAASTGVTAWLLFHLDPVSIIEQR